jgi:hypothetical protein
MNELVDKAGLTNSGFPHCGHDLAGSVLIVEMD